MFPVVENVYAGPSMAVGAVHAPKKINITKLIKKFLLIMIKPNLIQFLDTTQGRI